MPYRLNAGGRFALATATSAAQTEKWHCADGRTPGRLFATGLSGAASGLVYRQLLISGKGGVDHIWACDHYKTTLNAFEFKQSYKKRTDLVKDVMSRCPMVIVTGP